MCMNYNETSQWAADLGSGYSSIRPLGEGGMGTLYRAHKDGLDVDVVIKRVKQKFKGRMDERAGQYPQNVEAQVSSENL